MLQKTALNPFFNALICNNNLAKYGVIAIADLELDIYSLGYTLSGRARGM